MTGSDVVHWLQSASTPPEGSFQFTSFDAGTGGNVVNQVQREYNGLGQMIVEYQEHAGAVNVGVSLGKSLGQLNYQCYPEAFTNGTCTTRGDAQ